MKCSLSIQATRYRLVSLALGLALATAGGCSDDSDPPHGAAGKGGSAAGEAGQASGGEEQGGASNGGEAAGGPSSAGAGGSELGGAGGTSSGAGAGAGGDNRGGDSAELTVNAPADLATESASSYGDNEFGIITGETLGGWLDDWESNRPAGISGRLIILQQDSKAGALKFIAHDDEHVFTYGFAEHAYADAQQRNNGLLNTFATIPDGPKTDEILNQFGIDLTKDLVVFAFVDKDAVPGSTLDDASKATKVWYNTRSWWWLRYWGAAAEHLAILDGAAADVLDAAQLVATPSTLPATPGTFSVKQLRVDNTALKVDVGELIELVSAGGNELVLVDPRRKAEYFGEAFASPANPVNNKRPITEGRIKGARFSPWQATLEGVSIGGAPDYAAAGVATAVATHALRFKSKTELRALYDNDSYVNYDAAAQGAVTVHYCGHGRRASTWAFVSLGVLGVPARLYDGSWVEWGNLAGGTAEQDSPARPLPADSPWRTDTTALSERGAPDAPVAGVLYNLATDGVSLEASADGLGITPAATSTAALIEADRAYKLD